MKIDVRLMAFYEKGFAEHFQGIASLLKEGGYQKHIDNDESLYSIVDYLVDITRDPGVSSYIKKRIAPYVVRMSALKAMARDKLLAKKLEELDQCLYQLEDQFEDLERNV
jgi:hypothetical protein